MSNEPFARGETYWEDLDEQRPAVIEMIEQAESEWTIHAVVASGQSEDAVFVCVIKSMVGDSGLILSERMMRVPNDIESSDDLGMLDNGIHRRVTGPVAQALVRGYARTDNDRLAASDNADPLVMDAIGDDVEDDPAYLTEGSDDPHDKYRDDPVTHDCAACGEQVSESAGTNMGAALGTDLWVHDRCEGDQ